MRFFHDSGVTDFCSCTKSRRFRRNRHTVRPVHKNLAGATARAILLVFHLHCGYSLLLLPWMACMQALQEQKPAAKKSLFLKAPLITVY